MRQTETKVTTIKATRAEVLRSIKDTVLNVGMFEGMSEHNNSYIYITYKDDADHTLVIQCDPEQEQLDELKALKVGDIAEIQEFWGCTGDVCTNEITHTFTANGCTSVYVERFRKEITEDNAPAVPVAEPESEEDTTYRTNYAVAVNWLHNDFVLCNKVAEIDPSILDNARFAWYDEDTDEEIEVYQYFITSASDSDVEYLEAHFGLLFTYSDMLDCYVLCVDHFGTSWDYVECDTDIENAKAELGERL